MVNLLFFGIFYKFFLPGINTYQRSEEVTAPFVIYVIIVGILTLAMIVYWNSSQKRKLAICTLIMILLCGSIMPIVYILVIVMFKFVGFLISSDPPKESYKRNPSADLIDFYQKQEDEKNEKKERFRTRQEALSRARNAVHYAKNHAETSEEIYEIERKMRNLEPSYYEYDDPSDVEDFINSL